MLDTEIEKKERKSIEETSAARISSVVAVGISCGCALKMAQHATGTVQKEGRFGHTITDRERYTARTKFSSTQVARAGTIKAVRGIVAGHMHSVVQAPHTTEGGHEEVRFRSLRAYVCASAPLYLPAYHNVTSNNRLVF